MLITSNLQSNFFLPALENGSECITDPFQVQALLPQYDNKTIEGLMNVHRGPEGKRMDTLGLLTVVQSRDVFQVNGKTVKPSSELFALDLEQEATHPLRVTQPDHLEFIAEWDPKVFTSGQGNNILGDNGGFYFNESNLRVPVVKATAETLAYYGAVLIPANTAVRFPNEAPFPLWIMEVGNDYVKDYIMTENGGGGFYLEFHHDQPHFHMIVNGGGHYLLAKKVGENQYHLTAFELSNGQAVFTKKGAIHCDAALTGEIVCGYTASEDCETVLLRTKENNQMVNLNFVNP